MLESVLADVLTRVLGQYLRGIDRDSVRFGAWSGLVELRGVALRPEALAVLFETLGMDLPVTVEAGFIGLLRLTVPWKNIGTKPVRIEMEGITIMARPVCGDGSNDSELEVRERRIKRAKLNTDDAVREAQWGVNSEQAALASWSRWLVGDALLAKVVDNIQIELRDIILRFEDPYSDKLRPYVMSLHCKSLKAVSANRDWSEAFVESKADSCTRKLLSVQGFRIDWAPLTPTDAPGLSRGTDNGNGDAFDTPELLREFLSREATASWKTSDASGVRERFAHGVRSILPSVDGSLRVSILGEDGVVAALTSEDAARGESIHTAAVDLDVRFADVCIEIDDVQYASLLQTSVFFAKLSTRGFRPKTAKHRWAWAVEQLLPGFGQRRARARIFTEQGLRERKNRRTVYAAYRKAVLKARRTGVEEPKDIADHMEVIESATSFNDIIAFRNVIDAQLREEGKEWGRLEKPLTSNVQNPADGAAGTTTSSFWSMLGYSNDKAEESAEEAGLKVSRSGGSKDTSTISTETAGGKSAVHSLRVAFHLQSGHVRMCEGGFPGFSVPRVELLLRDLRLGLKTSARKGLLVEALLGAVEAWDIQHDTCMVYGHVPFAPIARNWGSSSDVPHPSSYPECVSEAIECIRDGYDAEMDPILDYEDGNSDDDSFYVRHRKDKETGQGVSTECALDGSDSSAARGRDCNRRSRDSTPVSSNRITETEFFGRGPGEDIGSLQHIAALRFRRESSDSASANIAEGAEMTLEVAIARLEAVVDGPQGSFLWGLRFWKPNRTAEDPLMAFLGAAAGARIAELRMELQQALLAQKIPMHVNAVIRAPRFIIPSKEEDSPAIVINMGTLGVRTSDGSTDASSPGSPAATAPVAVHYSNYMLRLDDIGMYIAPHVKIAVSAARYALRDAKEDTAPSSERFLEAPVDTSGVERLIQPFSLRFALQTLRDSRVVQVAHGPHQNRNSEASSDVSKLRIRGQVPTLALVLSQHSFQHLVVTAQRWGRCLSEKSHLSTQELKLHGQGWQPAESVSPKVGEAVFGHRRLSVAESGSEQTSAAVLTTLASYDIKVAVQTASLELRDDQGARLVTAVASEMCTNVVKTGRLRVRAEFTLQSWTVTDRSRGSTAAFRRLAYAGTDGHGHRGVSPPKSIASSQEVPSHSSKDDPNFVHIRYEMNLSSKEQTVYVRFLSLNMVCVRDTYLKLAAFFYGVQKHTRAAIKGQSSTAVGRKSSLIASELSQTTPLAAAGSSTGEQAPLPFGRISVSAELDGFALKLVSAEGALATVEMKDCALQIVRETSGGLRAGGDVGYFAVRDLTAPAPEHVDVIVYDKPSCPESRDLDSFASSQASSPKMQGTGVLVGDEARDGDAWSLVLPEVDGGDSKFQARFRGMRVLYLARFSGVMQRYFEVLRKGLQPALVLAWEMTSEEGEGLPNPGPVNSQGQFESMFSRRLLFEVDVNDVELCIPRHSALARESLVMQVSSIHVSNLDRPLTGYEHGLRVLFSDVQASICYTSPGDETSLEATRAPFLEQFSGELRLDFLHGSARREDSTFDNDQPSVRARFTAHEDLRLRLCEAQYTVLYFVMTENFSETIDGKDTELEVEAADIVSTQSDDENVSAFADDDITGSFEGSLPVTGLNEELVHMSFSIGNYSLVLLRGWNVFDASCAVVEVQMHGVNGAVKYTAPSRITFELSACIHSMSDMRPEANDGSRIFVLPLAQAKKDAIAETPTRLNNPVDEDFPGNVTISYDKVSGERASVMMTLSDVQFEVAPELMQDLSLLAIPGWPFLPSSAFAPEVEYLGRVLTVSLTNSQIVLCSQQFQGDRRSLVLVGEFFAKVDWMRVTAAKRVSVRTSGLEISLAHELPGVVTLDLSDGASANVASRHSDLDSRLLYPCDSSLEYTGPGIDNAGRRLEVSANSMLCRLNVKEAPMLFAVLSRLARLKTSYLSRRNWKQTSQATDERIPSARSRASAPEQVSISKEEHRLAAQKSMNIAWTTPAARFLFTDEGGGRFVPILELHLRSLACHANIPHMCQLSGEASMELFNQTKGWWEPGVEPWLLEASVSRGQSGSKAVSLRSDNRLNINVTPTTISAAWQVVQSLRSAMEHMNNNLEPHVDASNPKTSAQAISSLNQEPSLSKGEVMQSNSPSVAAFHVRNELGTAVMVWLSYPSEKRTVANGCEMEVDMLSERLLSSPAGRESLDCETSGRRDALRCSLSTAGFLPVELSAAEVGKHVITLHRDPEATALTSGGPKADVSGIDDPREQVLTLVWEVCMSHGVPICTIRSLIRLVNETGTALELSILPDFAITAHSPASRSPPDCIVEDMAVVVQPGDHFCLPVPVGQRSIRVRPRIVDPPDNGSNLSLDEHELDEVIREADLEGDDDHTHGETFFEDNESSVETLGQRRTSTISRPLPQLKSSSSLQLRNFDWSKSLPSSKWLYKTARRHALSSTVLNTDHSHARSSNSGRPRPQGHSSGVANASALHRVSHEVLHCRNMQGTGSDFYLVVVPRTDELVSKSGDGHSSWLDIGLRAPIVLENKLPGSMSYQVSQNLTSARTESRRAEPTGGVVLATGTVGPLEETHIHCSGESVATTHLSVAFDNTAEIEAELDVNDRDVYGFSGDIDPPALFGPAVSFADIESLRLRSVAVRRKTEPPALDKKERKDLHVTLACVGQDASRVAVYSEFWIRNRSDTDVEFCGRSSFYAMGTNALRLRARPPGLEADRYVCFEGPYISLRRIGEAPSSTPLQVHTEWWTCPVDLKDVEKPVVVMLDGRSLLLEVRPAVGYGPSTNIVTIRNASWIVNNTDRPIQWCQTSALDAHGNCRLRMANTLSPRDANAVHWDSKADRQSVHLRLANESGESDWIWSPAVPISIGHAGEIPAKMYRPKTQEQYIARVLVKSLIGGSVALVIHSEDRQNPPYCIVNSCVSRSVAFCQIGSEDRPWLVRPGKTTRYSWDDPLAPRRRRQLEIQILESTDSATPQASVSSGTPDFVSDLRPQIGSTSSDAIVTAGSGASGEGSSSRTTRSHQKCVVNIDVVDDRAVVLRDTFDPYVRIGVSVDGATKIVTFCDEGPDGQQIIARQSSSETRGAGDAFVESVPVVGWDDFGGDHKGSKRSGNNGESGVKLVCAPDLTASDFPRIADDEDLPSDRMWMSSSMDVIAVVYLESIGISVVDSSPLELVYLHALGMQIDYEFEADVARESSTFQVAEVQIDNQLPNPPYPVLLWSPPPEVPSGASSAQLELHESPPVTTLYLHVERTVTKTEIFMLKTLRAEVRPMRLSIDEELTMRILNLVAEISVGSGEGAREILFGKDGEHLPFAELVAGRTGKSRGATRRIYVEHLVLYPASLCLSSSTSRGSAVTRAAGYSSSLRSILAVILNVENCEFTFRALELQHVFDSFQHFLVLVQEFYVTQFGNQRLKLIASNSLVGNPAALFESVGIGARDLFVEPGRAKGSAEFLASVGRGSKSLLTHTVGGIVGSLSGVPRAVSAGLESAVGDREYLAERERIRGTELSGGRRGTSSTPSQGAVTGALSFAHGISSGVSGLFKEPVQGAMQGGAAGFFRGMGKGLVGGVVKPVTGAIDLIAEPAAGFSKQMAESEGSSSELYVVPERPPRAFRGQSQRLTIYDMRAALGQSLYKAVQKKCGVTYVSELLGWVELSDRTDRVGPGSTFWVWNLVRQYSRTMPISRKQIRAEQREAAKRQPSSAGLMDLRPEKTRVALLTESSILVVTLDCKLVVAIPLWSDASFRVEAEAKDVIIQTVVQPAAKNAEGSTPSSEAHGFIVAPWDASSAARRRKPEPGVLVVDRIPCASVSARDELQSALKRVTEDIELRSRASSMLMGRSTTRVASGVELSSMAAVSDDNAMEMTSTTKTAAADGSENVFVPMPMPGRSSVVQSLTSNETDVRRNSTESTILAPRSSADLADAVRRLSMSGTHRAMDSKRSTRVIVANSLPTGLELRLIRSSLDSGFWRVQPPQKVVPNSALMFEVDSGGLVDRPSVKRRVLNSEVRGNVLYGILASGADDFAQGSVPQVLLDFASPALASPSYFTHASPGFEASHERGNGNHATVVFRVRKSASTPGSSTSGTRSHLSSGIGLPAGSLSKRPDRSLSFKMFGPKDRSNDRGSGGSSTLGRATRPPQLSADELSVNQLVELGFTMDDALQALTDAGGDLVRAVDILTRPQ